MRWRLDSDDMSDEMNDESQEIESGKGKHQRTVTLNQDVADRMFRVCNHLGVTPSAYLKQIIGEAVSKSEQVLFPQDMARNTEAMMERFFSGLVQTIQEDQPHEEPRPAKAKRPKA